MIFTPEELNNSLAHCNGLLIVEISKQLFIAASNNPDSPYEIYLERPSEEDPVVFKYRVKALLRQSNWICVSIRYTSDSNIILFRLMPMFQTNAQST